MKGRDYITIAYKFHNLVASIIGEMEKSKNITTIISDSDKNKSDEEIWKEYDYNVRWTDLKVGIPILFNFYHGLELLLKGLITFKNENIKLNHSLSQLLITFENQDNINNQRLVDWFNKYVSFNNNPFKEVFVENNLDNTDSYHILFRYPGKKDSSLFNHGKLTGQSQNGLLKYLELKKDIDSFKPLIKEWVSIQYSQS